jgi:hypothetical protein
MYEKSTASSIVEAVTALVAVEVATADEAALGAACRRVRRVQGFLDAFVAAASRRSEELKAAGQGRGAETMLTRNNKVSGRQARQTVRRGEALDKAPALNDALAAGTVSAAHVDAFGNAVHRAGQAGRVALIARQQSLAARAATESPEEFAVSCQRVAALADDNGGVDAARRQRQATRLRRWRDEASGMFKMYGEFDPELGVRLWRAIDHATAANHPDHERPDSTPEGPDAAEHLAALALVDLVAAGIGDSGPLSRPPRGEFTVIIDYQTLLDGLHEASIVEVDPEGVVLPVATLRRLACESHLLPVVLNGDGVAVDVGRSRRLATADQRRALRAMYPRCAIAGCSVAFDACQIHHLDPFGGAHGHGETNLGRLLPLCHRHHHAAHEGHWHLTLDPTTRVLTVTLPDAPPTLTPHHAPTTPPDGGTLRESDHGPSR